MSELTEMPDWMWDLLDALRDYENEHSPLYRYTGEGKDGYERAECFGAFLTDRTAWPPREMQDAAEFRRHVIREHLPTTAHPDATAADGEA
jgi:hypothetical protein